MQVAAGAGRGVSLMEEWGWGRGLWEKLGAGRAGGGGEGPAFPSLSVLLSGFSGLGAPHYLFLHGRSTPGAWQWVEDQLGSAGVGGETGPGILEPDSCRAWPTDYERTPAFQPPVPAQ